VAKVRRKSSCLLPVGSYQGNRVPTRAPEGGKAPPATGVPDMLGPGLEQVLQAQEPSPHTGYKKPTFFF